MKEKVGEKQSNKIDEMMKWRCRHSMASPWECDCANLGERSLARYTYMKQALGSQD